MPLVEVRNLSFSYPGAMVPAIDSLSFSVKAGEYLAVVGANGSGKSTLLRCLNGLLKPPAGAISVGGFDPSQPEHRLELRRRLSLVFQSPPDQIVASVAEEDVAFGPENLGLPKAEMDRRVEDALRVTGLLAERKRPPRFLSAGQQQRLAVAGALAMDPECIVFDEATAMIDPSGRAELLDLIDSLVASGKAVIHITHDMEEASRAQRVLALASGSLRYDGDPQGLFSRADLAELGLEYPESMRIALALGLDPRPGESPGDLARRILALMPAQESSTVNVSALPAESVAGAAGSVASEDATEPAYQAADLGFSYLAGSGDERRALDGLSMEIRPGSSVALVGTTGSGKSTLLQIISALAQAGSGSTRTLGIDPSEPKVDLRSLRMRAPLSVQRPESAIFEPYVGDEVAFGPRNQGMRGAGLVSRVREALDMVELPYEEYRDRQTRILSGGQKRRVAIASVLAMSPELLVMDEPGSALDPASRRKLMDTLFLSVRGLHTLAFSTHSMEEAARADYVAVLSGGCLKAFGPPSEVFGKEWDPSWGLLRPYAAELAAELERAGIGLPGGILDGEGMAAGLRPRGSAA